MTTTPAQRLELVRRGFQSYNAVHPSFEEARRVAREREGIAAEPDGD